MNLAGFVEIVFQMDGGGSKKKYKFDYDNVRSEYMEWITMSGKKFQTPLNK